MTPEQAIATPVAGVEPGPTRYMAWDERKTLRDWPTISGAARRTRT